VPQKTAEELHILLWDLHNLNRTQSHNLAAVVVADSLVEVRTRWLVHMGSKPVLLGK
jgi:hypothetical protein